MPGHARVSRGVLNVAINPSLQSVRQPLRLDVVCMAGLEIGKLYSTPAQGKAASSFEELPLMPKLVEALQAAALTKPTEIQAMAVPAIMSGADYLLASQTGSGKTLAYLLPLVHMLKQLEADTENFTRRPKRPKIVVLGPTKELITSVAKSLCHYAKFRALGLTANTSVSEQAKKLTAPVDVVVATPTRFLQHQEAGNLTIGDVRWLVIDEADTMFDQGFGEEVTKVLSACKARSPPAQVVLVSATMTKAVKRLAEAQLPQLMRLEAAGFHKPTAGALQEFRVLPPGGDKMQMLMELLQGDVRKQRKVLVFCGSVDSCRAVEHHCQDQDLPTVCYHGDMPIAARKESMAAFADLAARGLDFPGTIDHVINFDFPSNAIDYLHRAGRTARAGAVGRVTSLVGPRDRRLATAIQYALDKDLPLDQVTASGATKVGGGVLQQPGPEQANQPKVKYSPVRYKTKETKAMYTPVKGQVQPVRWNPDHKFLHLKNGEPIVPFKELLKNKTGDERKRLLYEIAMDVKEWRRWRHAKAERWKQKMMKKRLKQQGMR
eukprot:gene13702-13824_t